VNRDTLRVVILSPALAVRAGLRTLLAAEMGAGSQQPPVEIIAEAASLTDLGLIPVQADLLLMTADSALAQELEQVTSASAGQLAILMLSSDPRDARILPGLPLRAWGFLPEDTTTQELLAALAALQQGLCVGDSALMQFLWTEKRLSGERQTDLLEPLTERESEVLQLLAQGLANKQIGVQLEISEHTVKFHVSSIYAKLGASNRAEAVRLGVQNGLILI
jgi:DNA-binding NarL/FixJ family response regulator